jgi:hypothetical protein
MQHSDILHIQLNCLFQPIAGAGRLILEEEGVEPVEAGAEGEDVELHASFIERVEGATQGGREGGREGGRKGRKRENGLL